MKRFFLLCTLLSLLPAAGCNEIAIDKEPVVRMIFSGSVVNQDGQPIPGLKVEPCAEGWLPDSPYLEFIVIGDPVFTDQAGVYRFDLTTKPWQNVSVIAHDVDGLENGLYLTHSQLWWLIDYSKSRLEIGDNTWDFGTVSFEFPRMIMKESN